MKTFLTAAALSLATLTFGATASLACDGDKSAKTAKISNISVDELDALMTKSRQAKKPVVQTVDVNGKTTREKMGVIPGSVMLTSSAKYSVDELGADKNKTQVFYCSNEKCSASKTAAKRAVANGFSDVRVLPKGIKGWKTAGQKTAIAAPRS